MAYPGAWTVIAVAGFLGIVGWFFITRNLRWYWLRTLLRWLFPVMLLTPAPVPGYDGEFAPAFIVVLFEGVFQTQGAPGTALLILAATLGCTLAFCALLIWRHSSVPEKGEIPN